MNIMELIHNFTLLIALTVLSGFLIQNKTQSRTRESILQGVIFGLVAIIGMLSPMLFMEGVFFDGRSVVLSLCALFFGPVAAGISTGMALVLRSAQGGNGIVMGDSVIVASALTGLFFHYRIFLTRKKVEIKHLVYLGFIVHSIMVLLIFALPKDIAALAFTKVALTVMTVYPIATVIIGKIISDYFSRQSYWDELKESEEKFRNLTENTTIAIAIYQNNKWVYANPVSTEMTGFTNNELMKMNFWDFVHPDDREKVMKLGKARQLSEKTEKSYEFRIITKDKLEKTVWLTGSSTTFNRKPAGLITVIDVTERKNAEKQLMELHEIINKSNSVAFTWKNEKSWPVEFVSDNVFNLTGYTSNDFITNKINFESIIHPDDVARVSSEVSNYSLEDGNDSFKHKMYRIITKNSEEKWVSDSTRILRNENGEIIYYNGIIEDVSERKYAEDMLKTSEEKFRAIFNSITDGIVLRKIAPGKMGEYLDVNRSFCELIGYTQEELKILPNEIFLDEEVIRSYSYILDQIYEKGKIGLKTRHKAKSGKLVPVEVRASLFTMNNEDYYVGVTRDISEMAEAEEILKTVNKELGKLTDELEQSNKDLENFAYIASHDLQEPLRMVSSFIQLLEAKHSESLNDEAKGYIRFAVEGSKKMKLLISGLLNFSRITTQGNEFKSMNVKDALESVNALFKDKLNAKNGTIEFKDLPEVITADESQIRQLFQNLIGNGLKFIKESVAPKIEISAEDSENEWTFRVKDNGIGIEDKHKERIFDMFRRLHGSEKFEGTGIGLAFCKQIVKRHGGRIWVESETGQGSTFVFTIHKPD